MTARYLFIYGRISVELALVSARLGVGQQTLGPAGRC